MNNMVIQTVALSKIYPSGGGEVRALNDVSLGITAGEFLALMGPSGSGKTTLLNLLGLIDRPSSGQVLFEGKDTTLMKPSELDKIRLTRIGFIFQTFNLLPTLTAQENVEFPLVVRGVRPKEREIRAIELLGWVGLSQRRHHRSRQLSAGESQRVAIARALSNQPSLILADEPTGNLDSKSKDDISQLLKQINRQYGTAIVLVTHDPAVAQVASRRVRMVDGRLLDKEEIHGG